MTSNTHQDPLAELSAQGVAVWLDDLSRELLASGALQSLITSRHVVGVTTNPTIFASALSKGHRYDDQLRDLAELGASTDTAIFTVTTDDVRAACDVLAPVYQQTAGRDGRVSIEVDPRLARDAAATADMARTLRSAVDRDNMFVKIPATPEGLSAITQVTSEGVSVNVTLIFALPRYRAVMDAYLSGLEQAAAHGRDLAAIRSVASFFISRVDTEVDTRPSSGLSHSARSGHPPESRTRPTPTPCTSPSWSHPAPSTPCQDPHSRRSPITAMSKVTRSPGTTTKPGAYSASSRPSVSTSMTSPLSLNATA